MSPAQLSAFSQAIPPGPEILSEKYQKITGGPQRLSEDYQKTIVVPARLSTNYPSGPKYDRKVLPQFLKNTKEDHQVHFDYIGFPEVDLGVLKNIKNTRVWNCIHNHVGPGGTGS